MNKEVRKYLAGIGEKGGRVSRRALTSEDAKAMVKVREAREAYQKYYTQCFWSFKPDLKITANDVQWVGRQIMKYGNAEAWETGVKLSQ